MMKYILPVFLTLVVCSCATYYQINAEFNQHFEDGDIQQAEEVLDKNKKAGKGKAQFLYYANQGVINAMLGNLEESNEWLEKAYLFGEDYHKNVGNIAASFLVNPNTIVYPGEDHEHLLLLYYKALNYLKMKDYNAALVECRRLNNRLYELSDKYRSDNKYKEDAFIQNLMGIIYEAGGDYNNAFIAYRNAYNTYEKNYLPMFGVDAPAQLKDDLIRSAALTGFQDHVRFYEEKFDRKYKPSEASGELVFFWHNGLGPVKAEWSINFAVVDGGPGAVTFVNEEYDMTFPFSVGSPEEKSELTDLRLFRVAFPKYIERKPLFDQADLLINNKSFALEKAEPVNAIAFKTLEERMLEELGKGLLRAAVKKSVEMAVRGDFSGEGKEDKEKPDNEKQEEALREGLSLLVGAFNAVTEKADTRNWQTIPHGIFYTRVPLEEGNNTVVLEVKNSRLPAKSRQTFSFDISRGETVFHTYQSLEMRR